MKSNIHALLHLADSLSDLGPGYVWWAFPGERFNGMLEGKVKSKVRIDASLGNALWMDQLLESARLARNSLNLYQVQEIYPGEEQQPGNLPQSVMQTPYGLLKSRIKNVAISAPERVGLQDFLRGEEGNIDINEDYIALTHSHRWGRLVHKQHTVGSRQSQSLSSINRDSSWIQFTNGPKGPLRIMDRTSPTIVYGEVHYFTQITTITGMIYNLARVHTQRVLEISKEPLCIKVTNQAYDILQQGYRRRFLRFPPRVWLWINIRDINSSVGRLNTENGTYIIHPPGERHYNLAVDFDNFNERNQDVAEHV